MESAVRARYVIAGALLFVLIGVAFRVSRLDNSIFSADETVASQHIAGYAERDVITAFSRPNGVRAIEAREFDLPGPTHGWRDVVATLAAEDPQHPPLYYLLAHGWLHLFGSSIDASRALPAILGLLGIACAGALCGIVTHSRIGGWVGAALFAVSPFQVVYAQEVREYSLFAALTLLSTTLLMASQRRPTVLRLGTYGLACIAGLYTFTMFVLVLAAHLTILAMRRPPSGATVRCVAVIGAAFVCWIPWVTVLVEQRNLISSSNDWSGTRWSLPALVAKWLFNGTVSFFDLLYLDALWAPVSLLVLLVIGVALFSLRRGEPDARAVVVSFIVWAFGSLAVVDLVSGGHRSTVARYTLPAFCALIVAVAAWVAQAAAEKRRPVALGSAFGLCLLAVASLVVRSTHDVWWDNAKEAGIPSIAAAINSGHLPVSVTDVNWPIMVNLARYSHDDISFSLTANDRLSGDLVARDRAFVVTTSLRSRHQVVADPSLHTQVIFVSSAISAPIAIFRRRMLTAPSAQDETDVDDGFASLLLVGSRVAGRH